MSGAVNTSESSRCSSIARLLGAHADGQLDAATTLEVDDHLLRCETCRERVALDRAIRGSLKKAVKMTAPADVRARMLAAMAAESAREEARRTATASATSSISLSDGPPPPAGRPAMLRHWRTMIPLASAAAIALAWNFASDRPLAAGASSGPSRLGAGFTNDDFINQLVEMHSRPIRPETPDPKEVRAFEREVGVPVHVPQLQNNARFVGGRLLPMAGGERAAMLQYEVTRPNGGVERVSVFIYDPRRVQIQNIDQLAPRAIGTAQVRVGQARGYTVAIAQHGSVGYAVASDLEDSTAQFVAAAESQ